MNQQEIQEAINALQELLNEVASQANGNHANEVNVWDAVFSTSENTTGKIKCSDCEQWLEATEENFYPSLIERASQGDYSVQCIPCRRERDKQYRDNKPHKIAQRAIIRQLESEHRRGNITIHTSNIEKMARYMVKVIKMDGLDIVRAEA